MAKGKSKGLTTESIVTSPTVEPETEPEPEAASVEEAAADNAAVTEETTPEALPEVKQPAITDDIPELKQPAMIQSPRKVRLRVPGLVGKFHNAHFNDNGESEEAVSPHIAALVRAQFEGVTEIE